MVIIKKLASSFNIIINLFIFALFILIAGTNFFNIGRTSLGYNINSLWFNGMSALFGMLVVGLFVALDAFNLFKGKKDLNKISKLGAIAETPTIKFLRNPLLRFGIYFVWVLLISLTSLSGFQIWQTTNVFSGTSDFQLLDANQPFASTQHSTLDLLWNIGVQPAMNEDIITFGMSWAFSIIILLLIYVIKLSLPFVKTGITTFNRITAIAIGILFATFGLGFIPGFVQAHTNVQGQNFLFLASAFMFQYFNQLVFWVTGLFLPIAHFTHNSIFALGFNISLSIFLFIPCIPQLMENNFYIPKLRKFVSKLHGGGVKWEK